MSTATPRPEETQKVEEKVAPDASHTFQGWLLIVLVFVAGATSMGIEMSASRLLAPYFGTSLFVWANLIGLILLYLTVGYYVGGRVADRRPYPVVLYGITAVASLWTAIIPVASRPILLWSQSAFASYSAGVFYGSLVAVILLFAVPVILLGCVSPYAIRLRVEQIGKSGRTAGLLYAISTCGSIVGTFLPVLVLIPDIGTRYTFFTIACALLLVSLVGLLTTRSGGGSLPKGKLNGRLLTLLLIIPLLLTLLGMQGPIKPPTGSNGGGILL
ncbi:MAG TPA: fused MFS/spermidine synthase, partial [Ktedonobacteraceae bacterium]|nr:fused MFS/spermidine synthase [Ktedonobacteraceae bacterium]